MAKKKSFNHYASTPYTQVPDGFWVSKAFNELSAQARCIFTIAISRWTPYEPDKPFPLPYQELREITRFQYNTISKSIKQLITNKFLESSENGYYPHNMSMFKMNHKLFSEQYPVEKKEWLHV